MAELLPGEKRKSIFPLVSALVRGEGSHFWPHDSVLIEVSLYVFIFTPGTLEYLMPLLYLFAVSVFFFVVVVRKY